MQRFRSIALITIAGALGLSGSVFAATTTLKQVQISNGSQIDLLFDGKVQKSQIRTEFINDIIQLSISEVSVYPAKISSVNGGNLTKIFAYQYAPRLVRCRLTVKGKAESYKDRFEVKAGGKILTIRVDEGNPAAVAKVAESSASAKMASIPDLEERALLNRVMSAAPVAAPAVLAKPAPIKEKEKDTITLSAAAPTSRVEGDSSNSSENLPVFGAHAKLGGAKPLPSPLKAFGKMFAVLGLFGLCALVFKKFAQSKTDTRLGGGTLAQAAGSPGWFGSVSRFAKKNLSRNGKMIEVLSTHYLGPKKSIAVVRIAGRMLVLGVSNESINLITQLSGDEADPLGAAMDDLDLGGLGISDNLSGPTLGVDRAQGYAKGSGAVSAGNPVFADMLTAERGRPQPASRPSQPQHPGPTYQASQAHATYREPVVPGTSANSLSSVRAQIRNRLEGHKQL